MKKKKLRPNFKSVVSKYSSSIKTFLLLLMIDEKQTITVQKLLNLPNFSFQYTPSNHKYPTLTIGEAFTAGYPYRRRVLLCMPTSVAIATTGEIFVADGYCNNQILKLNAAGILLMAIPTFSDTLTLNLPHSVTLLEHLDMVCVADRENMRIVCPKAGLKSYVDVLDPATIIEDPTLGRVFAVASHGDTIYAVNGPTSQNIAVRGFTVNAVNGNILDTWEPSTVSIYISNVSPSTR